MDENAKKNENKKHLTWIGSEWGGLCVDLDLIPKKGVIVSAGLDDDISFDLELVDRKDCFIIGIDPTPKAAKAVFRHKLRKGFRNANFKLLKNAVHGKTGLKICLGGPAKTFLSLDGIQATTISLDDLVSTYSGAALLKLDIEGAEFPALESLVTRPRIPQIAIGFHVWLNSQTDAHPADGVCPSMFTPEDVFEAVEKIKGMGYKLVFEDRKFPDRVGQETLFVRNQYAEKFHDLELRA